MRSAPPKSYLVTHRRRRPPLRNGAAQSGAIRPDLNAPALDGGIGRPAAPQQDESSKTKEMDPPTGA